MMSQDHNDPDLLALKALLRGAPPVDPAAKAAALNRALAAFDDISEELENAAKEQPISPRPMHDRGEKPGVLKGFFTMLSGLKWKPTLAATGSVAALAVAVTAFMPATELANPNVAPKRAPVPEVSATGGAAAITSELAAEPMSDAMAAPMAEPALPTVPQLMPAPSLERSLRRAPAAPQAQAASADAPADAPAPQFTTDQENYANAQAQAVKQTATDPVSTFAVDVDTASYAMIRNSLNNGILPNPDAVRIEEMVNYFPYSYDAPAADTQPFATHIAVMNTPWNANTRLVRIGLQGEMPAMAQRPPLNLVFLIDTSGSMEDPNKLPLLKQSLALMLPELRAEDQVAIVAYAGSAGEVLPPTPASEATKILAALDRLTAGGPTAGAEGLELAYTIAAQMAAEGEVSRVLLATDGDFNLGLQDPDDLERFIKSKAEQGAYLSVLGFGRGNLDDSVMQSLAQNGNGMAAYIDTLHEARKVLVDQLTGALFPIADDVKIQVEWNPAEVAEYRLLGFETRALAREDFNNDKVDAGEIGAGHQMTAIYEITPPGSPALRHDMLRYGMQSESIAPQTLGQEMGFLRLRYKAPGGAESLLIETAIPADIALTTDADAQFAAAIAGFGQLLREPKYLGDWGWDAAIALANANRGGDEYGYRAEAVSLMRMAQSLSKQNR